MAAFTNVFAWMGFSSLSLRWIDVGEAALLVYSMPIWATLFAWAVLGSHPTPRGLVALALGLSGIGVLLGAGGGALGAAKLPGVSFALAAAILFALGAVLNSRTLPVPPFALTAWQVGLGSLPMVVLGIALEQPAIASLSGASAWAFAYRPWSRWGLASCRGSRLSGVCRLRWPQRACCWFHLSAFSPQPCCSASRWDCERYWP